MCKFNKNYTFTLIGFLTIAAGYIINMYNHYEIIAIFLMIVSIIINLLGIALNIKYSKGRSNKF